MCGIAGFISAQLEEKEKEVRLLQMLDPIRHRGPDYTGTWHQGKASLGHQRLKIIDLSNEANQPFHYKHFSIVFNGEIYNYLELRRELQALGHQFVTHGDTEVILHAYETWGEEAVTRFVGMWAFALWDAREEKLFCSRDRFGIKPFYYALLPQGFFFASEYKSFKALPFFKRVLNRQQLNRGLGLLWAGYYDETFYQSLKQLEPAHHLMFQNGFVETRSYWDLANLPPTTYQDFAHAKSDFRERFEDAIRLHSRSDVETGMNLSGGLDSSSIASVFSTLFPELPVKAFTIFYSGKNGVDERPFVQEVVRKYPHIQTFEYSPSEKDIAPAFEHLASMADIPVFGSAYLSQYFVMKLARSQGVTVLLNGQGADEYLAGYRHVLYRILADQFKSLQWGNALDLFGGVIRRESLSMGQSLDLAAKSMLAVFNPEQELYHLEMNRALQRLGVAPQTLKLEDPFPKKADNALYHLLMHTTLPTLLHFEDRNSMAFSLESRVPFLDHRLVESVFAMPLSAKVGKGYVTKQVMREALKPVLPDAIYQRKDKKGFVTPGEVLWLNGPLSYLLEEDFGKLDWLDGKAVRGLISDYRKGDTSKARLVWSLACTHHWMKYVA